MIERFDIHFIHAEHDEKLEKYVTKKIGKLDKYLPRHARENPHAEVFLKESKSKQGKDYCCEVSLHLPRDVINVSETNVNMYAAIDIIEMKLRHQIRKYKETHSASTLRRLATRFAR
jgi:putative sigma-54 modulation protein